MLSNIESKSFININHKAILFDHYASSPQSQETPCIKQKIETNHGPSAMTLFTDAQKTIWKVEEVASNQLKIDGK